LASVYELETGRPVAEFLIEDVLLDRTHREIGDTRLVYRWTARQ
jgi:hypothetical protein